MFQVGIVGCGGIAQVHAQVLGDWAETSLAACADIRPERARAMAEKYGCRAYGSMEEMLEKERLDAVHLCTPHYLHPTMALEAAKRGAAVFTEKPPAIDEEGWAQIREAAAIRPLGVCFQNRYNANVLECRRMLDAGEYGKLRGLRAFVTWNRTPQYYTGTDWKGKWATEGGGALINQAVHTLDLAVWLCGMPDRVESTLRNHHLKNVVEVEDTAEIYLKSRDKTALLYFSTAYTEDSPVLIDLQLERASLRLEDDRLQIREDGGVRTIEFAKETRMGRAYWGAGHSKCIRDFYRSIREGRPYRNDAASCENTMRVLLDIYAQNGRDLA
ncbi:MAG: Gfo/Idh/MocA family oxidoreductase [Clostridia bacterium]|nr:Gfo/Idh/MocA family oxidoreductase [Clostridia bacterium]